MFSSALRSQSRLNLFKVAVPASRSLTSFTLSRAALQTSVSVPRATAAVAAQRAFSSANVLSYESSDSNHNDGPAPPASSVYIGNMPWKMTKEDLADMFSEFGTVESVRIQTHADGRPRGFAHLTFASKESAIAAVTSAKEEPLHISGRDLVVDYARRPAATYTEMQPNKSVYFRRFNEDESELRAMLDDYNDSIVNIHFMRDGNTGERLKAGFIEFRDVETATEVINRFNGQSLEDGSEFRLAYARARKEGPNGDRAPRQERPHKRGHYTSRQFNPRPPREDADFSS